MFSYGMHSKAVLVTLHPDLQLVLNKILEYHDLSLLRGVRTLNPQQIQFAREGLTTTLDSRHLPGGGLAEVPEDFPIDVKHVNPADILRLNQSHMDLLQPKDPNGPSFAVDFAAYIKGRQIYREKEMATLWGHLRVIGIQEGVELRWGGDWDRDQDQSDQRWNDLVHVELWRRAYP